jgi:SagB-type dehydrogenase family enzyme
MSSEVVDLAPESGESLGDLGSLLERRRSTRRFAAQPLSFSAFSSLLCLTAKNRVERKDVPLARSYPSGGACHSLEIYPIVRAGGIEGVAAGVHRYRPESHQLELVSSDPVLVKTCMREASQIAALEGQLPGVLLQITSRITRVSAAYEGLAYSLVLKEVGCLIQTMYLVAAGLNLGICALGRGPSNALPFVDPWTEPPVGELVLGVISSDDLREDRDD